MEIIIVLARLIAPFSILRFPLAGTLFNAALDMTDYWFIGPHSWYQSVDKILDTYYLSFGAVVVLRWKDIAAKYAALGLYAFRLVGTGIFLATQQAPVLFFFPNLFESFFVFYLIYTKLARSDILLRSWPSALLLFAALLIPQMFTEYTIHIYKPGDEQHLGILGPIFVLPQIASALLWLTPPALVMAWLVWRAKKQSNMQ